MYVAADPRSAMRQNNSDRNKAKETVAQAGYFNFDASAPSDASKNLRNWYAQAANFVVVYSEAQSGADLSRKDQADEYMILLPESETSIEIEWSGSKQKIEGYSVIFVPAGVSDIKVLTGGPVVRFFTRKATDIVERCAALLPPYHGDENVPPLEPWPDPVGGEKVRSYSLDIEPVDGRFGRIFRSRNFMVNYIYPRQGPRDRSAMSPHKHDEFQQCSLCLEGTYLHHLRWPWGTDANTWKDDDHETCGAPSVAIIPAVVLHTSEAVGQGINQLVDVFCPPREDFSNQDGWVLNAVEYPAPAK